MVELKRPHITIDESKCVRPHDCGQCLKVCDPGVLLLLMPKGKSRQLGREPETWKIIPIFGDRCSGCQRCSDVCPQHAINIGTTETAEPVRLEELLQIYSSLKSKMDL